MASSSSPQRGVTVVISEPQKLGDGLQAYISYKVTATFAEPPPGSENNTFTVIRRFSDFVWLRGALRDTVPWAIVPCLPEKQQLGRFNNDFVEIRLRALQRWSDKVTASQELAASDPLKKFLTLPYDALAALRDGSRGEMVKSVVAESRTRVMKLLKTATTTITTTIAEVRGGTGGISSSSAASGYTKGSSADDAAFASIEAYLLGQAGPLTAVYNAAAALAIRYREQAQLLLDHGAALRSLGSTEGGAYGTALSSVGLSTWAASTAAYEQVRGGRGSSHRQCVINTGAKETGFFRATSLVLCLMHYFGISMCCRFLHCVVYDGAGGTRDGAVGGAPGGPREGHQGHQRGHRGEGAWLLLACQNSSAFTMLRAVAVYKKSNRCHALFSLLLIHCALINLLLCLTPLLVCSPARLRLLVKPLPRRTGCAPWWLPSAPTLRPTLFSRCVHF